MRCISDYLSVKSSVYPNIFQLRRYHTLSQGQSPPQPYPSQTQLHNNRVYLIVILVLLVALVATSGVLAYLYVVQSSNLNSQIQRTSNLNNQNANLDSQNANLQNQINQLKNQIDSLQSQVNSLRSELSNTVNVTYLSGTVTVSSSTPVSIIFYSGSNSAPSASSAVYSDNSYFVVVNNGVSFTVVIVYVSASGGIYHCNATPYVYNSPSGESTSASQNFFC